MGCNQSSLVQATVMEEPFSTRTPSTSIRMTDFPIKMLLITTALILTPLAIFRPLLLLVLLPTLSWLSSLAQGATADKGIEPTSHCSCRPPVAAIMPEGNPNSNCHEPSLEDDLICAITLSLPFDPVMAEDGRIYERSAIEKHFESSNGEIKSPITNQVIGTELLPASQHKNIIELSVKKGLVSSDLSEKWSEKIKQKKKMDKTLKKAEAGDVEAMYLLGYYYRFGRNGVSKDHKKAYLWYDRAHQAGSVAGTARVGEAFCLGSGVEKDQPMGLILLSVAAGQGSDLAASVLGKIFAKGLYGTQVDKSLAIHWLEKATSGESPVQGTIHLSNRALDRAQELLDELKNQDD